LLADGAEETLLGEGRRARTLDSDFVVNWTAWRHWFFDHAASMIGDQWQLDGIGFAAAAFGVAPCDATTCSTPPQARELLDEHASIGIDRDDIEVRMLRELCEEAVISTGRCPMRYRAHESAPNRLAVHV
jgi:hypothetical protein